MAIRVWLSPRDVCALMATQSAMRRIKAMLAQSLQVSVESPEVLFAMASFSKFYSRFYNACIGSQDPEALDRHRLVKVPRLVYLLLKSLGFCIFQTEVGEAPLMGPGGYPVCAGPGLFSNPQWAAAQHAKQGSELKSKVKNSQDELEHAKSMVQHFQKQINHERALLRNDFAKTHPSLKLAEEDPGGNVENLKKIKDNKVLQAESLFNTTVNVKVKDLDKEKDKWQSVANKLQKEISGHQQAQDLHGTKTKAINAKLNAALISEGKKACDIAAKSLSAEVLKDEGKRCSDTVNAANKLVELEGFHGWDNVVQSRLNPHVWVRNADPVLKKSSVEARFAKQLNDTKGTGKGPEKKK